MHDPFRREIIERNTVAGAAATACLWRIVGFRRRGRCRQGLVCQHVAAVDRSLHMRSSPNLVRPVDRMARGVEDSLDPDHMRGADRFEAELFLAPPLHADAMTGELHRDDAGTMLAHEPLPPPPPPPKPNDPPEA